MPRAPALPKGNALITHITRPGGSSPQSKKQGGNALVRSVSYSRNYERMGTGPVPTTSQQQQTEKGKSKEDAIDLGDTDEEEDELMLVTPHHAPWKGVAKPEPASPPLPPTSAHTPLSHTRTPTKPRASHSSPSTISNSTPRRITRQSLPHRTPMTAGRADQPIQLLSSSDEDDSLAPGRIAQPSFSSSRAGRRAAPVGQAAGYRAQFGSGGKRQVYHPSSASTSRIPLDENMDIDPPSSSSTPFPRQQQPPRPSSSGAPTRALRSLSFQPRPPLDPRLYARPSGSDEDEDWESYHAGFPPVSSSGIKAAPREEAAKLAALDLKADVDARLASQCSAAEEKRRKRPLGVVQEPLHPTQEVLTVFLNPRGEPLDRRPEFPWDTNEVGPPLSVRRVPDVLLSRGAGPVQAGGRAELVRRGERRRMRVVRELVGTSGGIWNTDQSRNGTIAIAASASTGEESWRTHDEEYVLNAYNKGGNVSVWKMSGASARAEERGEEAQRMEQVEALEGHSFRDVFDPALGAPRPHYAAVLSVAFDRRSEDSFFSSSADGTVRKWERPEPETKHVNTHTWTYSKHPHHLVFHKDEPLFAVGGGDGHAYVHSGSNYLTQQCVRGEHPDRQVSSLLWGRGPTSQMLFFATEHPGHDHNDGEAYAADYTVGTGEVLYRFPDVPGGGAVMTLDSTGSRLAIVAGKEEDKGRQSLMIYEPQMFDAETVLEARLPEFGQFSHPASLSGSCDIMDVQWSPCGTYIAIARDNNCALVYDMRNAARPLHVFGHVTYSREDTESRFGVLRGHQIEYGICNVGWMGYDTLVTGGADGCVRRWNTSVDTKGMGGKVLARLDQPVSHLWFPNDTQQYRYPLVAGDMEGKVYVFDYDVGLSGGSLL